MIRAVAFKDEKVTYPQTMGGKIWWNDVKEKGGYRIQQNILSKHYRILNAQDERMISSFDKEEIDTYFDQLKI